MKITGSHSVDVPRERLWAALQDPAVLARTLPGCESLESLGGDVYAATVTAGVASIRGTYTGQVQLQDKQPPTSYRLSASGSGAPGTIQADALVRLEEVGQTTTVHYEADAVVGGMLGGVGQRMIAGAARRTAGEFFAAVADDVRRGPPVAATTPAGDGPSTPGEVGQVFPGKAVRPGGWFRYAPSAGGSRAELMGAFVLGAAAALAGVLVGRRLGRGSVSRHDDVTP